MGPMVALTDNAGQPPTAAGRKAEWRAAQRAARSADHAPTAAEEAAEWRSSMAVARTAAWRAAQRASRTGETVPAPDGSVVAPWAEDAAKTGWRANPDASAWEQESATDLQAAATDMQTAAEVAAAREARERAQWAATDAERRVAAAEEAAAVATAEV